MPGTIVELHDAGTADERLLNVAYFIDNNGKIIGKYVKKNLWGSIERLHLTSSSTDPHPVFDTPLGKVGILVCWDLAFPEAFRELIADGAEIICVPSFWTMKDSNADALALNPDSEAVFLNSTIVSRAFENTCAVVYVNAGGPPEEGEQTSYAGISQLAVPHVGPVGRMGRAEGMALVDLDMNAVKIGEANYKVRQDMQREGWHYAYTRTRDTGNS